MKVLFLGVLVPAILSAAELKDVKSVYLYPMAGGLDQHLANQLTSDHVFRVVADPKLADAVFTDQLGAQLEYRLDHIKRPPMANEAAGKVAGPAPAVTPGAVPAPAAAATVTQNTGPTPPATATSMTESEPHSTTFSRGKGTLFLVDTKSRQVVWSDYRRPKNTSSHELNRTAKQIAVSITKTLAPPPAITQ